MAGLVSLSQAQELVWSRACVLPVVEHVPLLAALHRHAAAEYATDGPWPTTDRSAMDGFAVVAGAGGLAAGTVLPVVGESLAGHPFGRALGPREAIRIMTGAVVPAGADAVVPVEQTSGYAGAEVTLQAAVARGANIRPCGSELAAATVVVTKGQRLRAAEIGVLAVLGIAEVAVVRRPRVAILSTGDEVVPLRQTPASHQVRDSNSWALAAQVLEAGGEPIQLGIAGDEAGVTRRMLAAGLADADVLLSIGGISEGTHDLVQQELEALGVAQVFHGIALKPGKPTFFGMAAGGNGPRFVFGLPGNPASCFTVFDLLVAPLLARLQGAAAASAPGQARLAGPAFRTNPRLQAIPARITADAQGLLQARLAAPRSSGDPFSLLPATGYALVPPAADAASTPAAPVCFYGGGPQPR